MTPIEVYKTYLAFKNHFTKPNYDYHQYCGKSRASKEHSIKEKIDTSLKECLVKKLMMKLNYTSSQTL